MLFSYNWLKDYLNYYLAPKDIKALLMSFSPLEVESMEKRKGDTLFDVKILANRMSDCASHYGLAREINALAKIKGFKKIARKKDDSAFKKILRYSALNTADYVDIIIESPSDCPRYGGMLMELKNNNETPEFITKRLNSVGVKPINPIVDLSNYILIDSGQPTHPFDFDKLFSKQKKKKIIIRRAKNGEKINALDEKTYILNPEILVIADEQKPIAIAGIKGGKESAVLKKTKTIFLEYAIFNPKLIYQASGALRLNSDASARFSHGVFIDTMERSVNLFKKIASSCDIAYPSRSEVVRGNYKQRDNKISVNKEYINERLALNLSEKNITGILSAIGCGVKIKKDALEVIAPPYRSDLTIKEDLVEEIGRVCDFNIVPYEFSHSYIFPTTSDIGHENEHQIKQILTFNSFDEIISSSLVGENDLKYFDNKIKLKNYLSLNHAYLRQSLAGGILKAISRNKDNFSEIKIFEIGMIFPYLEPTDRKSNITKRSLEKKSLLFASYNNKDPQAAFSRFSDFYLVRKTLSDILSRLNISFKIGSSPKSIGFFEAAYDIIVGDRAIGKIGNIKEQILNDYDIKGKAAACEIDIDNIIYMPQKATQFKQLSEFPRIIRDVSFYLSPKTQYQDIEKTIKSAKINFLEEFNLIDVYQGKNADELLSLTMRFVFRHNDRTLKDREANKEIEKIEKMLVEKFKAKIR